VKQLARALGSALLALALIAGVIARLRRVERPVFERVSSDVSGRVQLGPVRLARHGEQGRVIGWAVRCDGREVWSRLGDAQQFRLETRDGVVHVRDVAGAEPDVVMRGCEIER
jgi:hypothetical protein